jgi:hypothetical protein
VNGRKDPDMSKTEDKVAKTKEQYRSAWLRVMLNPTEAAVATLERAMEERVYAEFAFRQEVGHRPAMHFGQQGEREYDAVYMAATKTQAELDAAVAALKAAVLDAAATRQRMGEGN